MTNEALIYYDYQDGEQLIQRSRFRIKPQYRQVTAKKNILTILSETGVNKNIVLLIDLVELEIADSLEFENVSLCDNLDLQAIVITGGKSSLRVEGLDTAKAAESLTLPAHEVTSFCVHTCKADERYLLACGQRDGKVLVWQIEYLEDKWQSNLLLKKQVHEGIVSSLCFLDDFRIISGGVDRKISILGFGEDSTGLQGTVEQDLCLTLRCQGLKIDNVQGPREKKMLEKLVKKATRI
jgi:WD40 repeat protein